VSKTRRERLVSARAVLQTAYAECKTTIARAVIARAIEDLNVVIAEEGAA